MDIRLPEVTFFYMSKYFVKLRFTYLFRWGSSLWMEAVRKMCRFNSRQTERIRCLSSSLQLVLREHKWIGAHKKSKNISITNWGSRNIYSKAKVNTQGCSAFEAPLYSINGHPPSIAEDSLKEGQPSILCMSNMSNKVINPLTWPRSNECSLALLWDEKRSRAMNCESSAAGREEQWKKKTRG